MPADKPNLTDRQKFQIYAILNAAEGRIANGANIDTAFEWAGEELSDYFRTGIEQYDYEE